ncbi:hypothetical protein GT039_37350 [Streptomyces sp. SID2955]|nr:hypothetical protein [Streptomyces sp. SID2955]
MATADYTRLAGTRVPPGAVPHRQALVMNGQDAVMCRQGVTSSRQGSVMCRQGVASSRQAR